MKTSDTGIKLIQGFESLRTTAYRDAVGVWTIGYGHTKGVRQGQKITKEKAVVYLKEDLATAEQNVMKFNGKYHWNQNEFDAMVSFAFNVGSINQLTACGTRSKAEISKKILEYNKAKGKVLNGLTRRRKAEKALFDKKVTGNLSNGGKSTQSKTSGTKAGKASKLLEEVRMPTIKKGSTGKAVKIWQIIVGANVDGDFGSNTLSKTKTFQKAHGLKDDGIVGDNTWKVGLDSV